MTIGARDAFQQLLGPQTIRLFGLPIHDIGNDLEPVGVEVLMRGPAGAPYESPTLAFAMAATLDSLEQLDSNCIEAASRVTTDGLLFINVHPRTLVQSTPFWERIGIFGSGGTRSPERVVFEIVEHSPARETDLPDALRELRALGFRIAIDDLGEGMSGLRRLVEVEPEYVKVDRFFIDGIDCSERKRAVVRAIGEMASAMGSEVIAEGVETSEELDALRECGVPLCQGFLFGKPEELR